MPVCVLGTGLSHDGSTCLLRDGRVAVAIEKERLTRKKHDGFNDRDAIKYCLDAEGIRAQDLALIVQNANFSMFSKGNSWFRGPRDLPAEVPDVASGSPCGTSYAAPTLTGAAIDFIDFYRSNISNVIDAPGALHAAMLLMGDRQGEAGKLTSGFDGLWGAGRLRMRRWDAYGLDDPEGGNALAVVGYTCVFDGLPTSILNGTIPADVNIIKAAIYWYDRRPDDSSSTSIDNIDLFLYQEGTSEPVVSSESLTDNKERLFYEPGAEANFELVIFGTDVTATDEGCGEGGMVVYISLIIEDSERESNDIHSEFGTIETEN